MNILYTLLFIVNPLGVSSGVVTNKVVDLSYGDCAEQIVKMKQSRNLVVIYADCVPQTEVKRD